MQSIAPLLLNCSMLCPDNDSRAVMIPVLLQPEHQENMVAGAQRTAHAIQTARMYVLCSWARPLRMW